MDYLQKIKTKNGSCGFLTDGFFWCCGAPVDIMGLVGMLLLMMGVAQIGSGSYFMLILPIFDVASNIWTGIVTGAVGAVLMYFGSTNQTRPRAYTNLALSLIALIVNIINLIIIVVGEKSQFLSEEDKLRIDHEHKHQQFSIAIWLTACLSVATSLITFSIAQYIFCIQLRLGSRKVSRRSGESADAASLHPTTVHTEQRFYPPSRMNASKKMGVPFSSVEDMPHSNTPAANAWVYNPEDKWNSGLYPLGFESHQETLESVRRPPARHSSFAAPRYARVLQRPQRAQSFVVQRDSFSIHPPYYSKLHPVSVPTLPLMRRPHRDTLRRSSSLSVKDQATTLSSKYRAFSLGRQNDSHVLEVGSLVSTISEHSLVEAIAGPGTLNLSASSSQKLEPSNGTATLEKMKLKPPKGPAPLPPIKPLQDGMPQSSLFNRERSLSASGSLADSEDFCTCRSENEEEVKVESLAPNTSMEDVCSCSSKEEISDADSRNFGSQTTKCEDEDVPDFSPSKIYASTPKKSDHQDFLKSLKSHLTSNKLSNPEDWSKLERLLTDILDSNSKDSSSTKVEPKIVKSQSHRSVLRSPKNLRTLRNVFPDSAEPKLQFRKLPSDEVQKNKIVLRVPSFKDTSCQTESYRPVRRRATLSQASQIPLPRVHEAKSRWEQDIDIQISNITTSSSSGYSSPDGESKGTSPLQSGPPSPSSPFETKDLGGPNVTIIEVNRSESPIIPLERFFLPPRPPKPTRQLRPSHYEKDERQPTVLPSIKETPGTESSSVAEALNPFLNNVHAPRIVDVVRKGSDVSRSTLKPSTLRTNSLSLPRVHLASQRNCDQNTQPPHPTLKGPVSTAAYLASLQLLASHYRQQAIDNAKQLQRQRRNLDLHGKDSTFDSDSKQSARGS